MTEDRRNSLVNALELAILFLVALSVSLRPLVCGEGARYTLFGLVDAPVANLLVSLPFLFAFLLWIPRMALKAELRLTRTGMAIPIALFVVFVIRSVFVSQYEWRSAMTALYWIGQILLFFLLKYFCLPSKRLADLHHLLDASPTVVVVADRQRRYLSTSLDETFELVFVFW